MTAAPFRLLNVIAAADLGGTEVLCRELVRHFASDDHIDTRVCCILPGTLAIRAQLEEASGYELRIAAARQGSSRIAYLWEFLRICRDLKPDGLVVHFFGLDVVFLAIVARWAGVRAVTTKAGNPAPKSDQEPVRALKWKIVIFLLSLVRVPIVSSSAWIQTSLTELRRLPKGSCVIHNGTSYDLVSAEAATARGMRRDREVFVLGALGRLEKIKDFPTILRALARFKKMRPQARWRLDVIGDGPDRGDLTRLTEELGLGNQVVFLGARRDVYTLLGGWDLFLFSTTRDEGFGIVLIEAMAAGLQILASDAPACREVLSEGMYGTLFPGGDAEELARLIAQAYDARHQAAAIPRGREEFDIKTCASKHLALVEQIAGHHV